MKYFISVYSPARRMRRTFLLDAESAESYYKMYMDEYDDLEIRHSFKEGKHVYSENEVHVWGENISDNEIFYRRLKQEIDPVSLM